MTVLSNKQIVEARESGHVVIEPFSMESVRKASYDLTLGEFFYRGSNLDGFYNPFAGEREVAREFEGPYQAKPYFNVWRKLGGPSDWPIPRQAIENPDYTSSARRFFTEESNHLGLGLEGIPDDHPVIVLLPGEFILAHSHEFAGIRAPGTTMLKARSSWGRNRISVCLCAGLGDPGYVNRWTMEIHNLSRKAIPLPVGERISQLVFFETGEVYGGQYGEETSYVSKYQDSQDISEVMLSWRPQNMLPRNYMDQRRPLEAPLTPERNGR